MTETTRTHTEQQQHRGAERPRLGPWYDAAPSRLTRSQADILTLQRAAGNGAVSQLLQSGTGNFASVAMSEPLARVPQGAGRPLSIIQCQWLERSTGPLPSIITEEGKEARKTLAKANAHAATRGSQILAEPNALKGEKGKARLAHEVAHVLQQQSSNLPFGTTEQAEADADAFSHSVMAGRPAAVRFSAPLAWAYDKKKIRKGDRVASMLAVLSANAVVVTMQSGDTLQYSLIECALKPDSYRVKRAGDSLEIKTAKGVDVQLIIKESVHYIFAFKAPSDDDVPDALNLPFPEKPVPLTIIESPGDMPTTKVAPEAGEGVSPPAKVAGAKTEQKKTLPSPPGKEQLPPEVVDFYKGSTVPEGQQIPANELLKMHQTFTKFVKGKPQWGAEGQSFKAWVDFLEKTGERLRGQTELTEHGKLTLDVLEDLMKKLEKGQRLEFPGQEEKELAEKARKAREKEGPPKLSDRPELLLIPADDRKFLLEVAERHPDLFEETAALDDVKRVTYQMKRALALQIAVKKHMPSEIQAALIRMAKDPVFWAFLAGSIAVYVGLWLAPEPISKVIATGLTAFLLAYTSLSAILKFADAWSQLSDKCKYNARTADDLDTAAQEFAVYLGEQGAEILLLIAFWLGGRAVRAAKTKTKASKAPSGGATEPTVEPKAPSTKKPGKAVSEPEPTTKVPGETGPAAQAVPGGKPEIISFGKGQRRELIRFWESMIKKNPAKRAQYEGYINRIRKGKRPTWKQSEMEMEHFYRQIGAKGETGFKHGRQAPRGGRRSKGSTKPDVVHTTALVEVKNYKIINITKLIKTLKKQIAARRAHGPYDIKNQSVILDMRGQKASLLELLRLRQRVAQAIPGLPIDNIQVVTW